MGNKYLRLITDTCSLLLKRNSLNNIVLINKTIQMNTMGKILWQDLTVENAEQVKDFYCSVVDWTFENVNQGDYNDFNIIDPALKEVVARICHKKGEIKGLPSQWLNYVMVESI